MTCDVCAFAIALGIAALIGSAISLGISIANHSKRDWE